MPPEKKGLEGLPAEQFDELGWLKGIFGNIPDAAKWRFGIQSGSKSKTTKGGREIDPVDESLLMEQLEKWNKFEELIDSRDYHTPGKQLELQSLALDLELGSVFEDVSNLEGHDRIAIQQYNRQVAQKVISELDASWEEAETWDDMVSAYEEAKFEVPVPDRVKGILDAKAELAAAQTASTTLQDMRTPEQLQVERSEAAMAKMREESMRHEIENRFFNTLMDLVPDQFRIEALGIFLNNPSTRDMVLPALGVSPDAVRPATPRQDRIRKANEALNVYEKNHNKGLQGINKPTQQEGTNNGSIR